MAGCTKGLGVYEHCQPLWKGTLAPTAREWVCVSTASHLSKETLHPGKGLGVYEHCQPLWKGTLAHMARDWKQLGVNESQPLWKGASDLKQCSCMVYVGLWSCARGQDAYECAAKRRKQECVCVCVLVVREKECVCCVSTERVCAPRLPAFGGAKAP
eukprot:1155962-Pelagomonas_calceolata.AAC.1